MPKVVIRLIQTPQISCSGNNHIAEYFVPISRLTEDPKRRHSTSDAGGRGVKLSVNGAASKLWKPKLAGTNRASSGMAGRVAGLAIKPTTDSKLEDRYA